MLTFDNETKKVVHNNDSKQTSTLFNRLRSNVACFNRPFFDLMLPKTILVLNIVI